MSRGGVASRVIASLMFMLVLAWAAWLWHARKTPLDYVVRAALGAVPIPACQWVPVNDPRVVTLGVSKITPPPWTDGKIAYLAFRTDQPDPAYVEVGVIMVLADHVSLAADGGPARKLRRLLPSGSGILRLPLSVRPPSGVHTITIKVAHPKPPSGREQRWLGVALDKIQVCGDAESAQG